MIHAFLPLLAAVALVLGANGLETILLPYRALNEDFTRFDIGLIGSSYWLGLAFGCFCWPQIARRLEHRRCFILAAALAAVPPLAESIWISPPVWWVARAGTGLCFAGLLTVTEGWLAGTASDARRGGVLSAYSTVNFSAIIAGQQLIRLAKPAGQSLFLLCSSLYALAALLLATADVPAAPLGEKKAHSPIAIRQVSPLALLGCAGAGLANSAFWAFGPVYAQSAGFTASATATFMTSAVLGGVVGQWPAGMLSDRYGRRLILIALPLLASVAAAFLAMFGEVSALARLILVFLFGAFALPVYFVSVAQANDGLDASLSTHLSSRLLLVFAVSASVGPVFASITSAFTGTSGVFVWTVLVHCALALAVGVASFDGKQTNISASSKKETQTDDPCRGRGGPQTR